MGNETGIAETVEQGAGNQAMAETKITRSASAASFGIRTTRDAGNVLSAIVTDVLNGDLVPKVASVAVGAIGKLVSVKELALKHGGESGVVALSDDLPIDAKEIRRRELQEELSRLK